MSNMYNVEIDPEMAVGPAGTKSPYVVNIKQQVGKKAHELKFPLCSIVTKRQIEKMDANLQFAILNDYLNKKGDKFKAHVFETYQSVFERIQLHETAFDTEPLDAYGDVEEILNLFSIDELIEHAQEFVNAGHLTVPSKLPDVNDKDKVTDGIRSEEQTYLKSDYIQLVGLVTYIKATFPILLMIDSVFLNEKTGSKKDRILFDFYFNYGPFVESAPVKKLLEFTEQIALGPKREEADIKKQMLEKSISREEFTEFFVSQLVIEHLTVLPVIGDSDTSHSVNTMYNFLIGRIENRGTAKHRVLEFTPSMGIESGEEGRGYFESIEQSMDISITVPAVLNHSLKTLDVALRQFSKFENQAYKKLGKGLKGRSKEISLKELNKHFLAMKDNGAGSYIPESSVMIVRCFAKKIIDPRMIPMLNIYSISNLLTLTFRYVYDLGFKHLAFSLLCYDNHDTDSFAVYASNDLKKIDTSTQEALRYHFQCHTPKSKKNPENIFLIEETINTFCKEFMNTRKVCFFPMDIVTELFEEGREYLIDSRDRVCHVAPDSSLKINLAKFLIANEENI